MQHFLLFFTMVITVSQALPKRLDSQTNSTGQRIKSCGSWKDANSTSLNRLRFAEIYFPRKDKRIIEDYFDSLLVRGVSWKNYARHAPYLEKLKTHLEDSRPLRTRFSKENNIKLRQANFSTSRLREKVSASSPEGRLSPLSRRRRSFDLVRARPTLPRALPGFEPFFKSGPGERSSSCGVSPIFYDCVDDEDGKSQEAEESKERDDVLKLKRMLEEMETVLKAGSDPDAGNVVLGSRDFSKVSPANSIKEKIDKMAIPILTEISEDLSQQQCKNATLKKGFKSSKPPCKKVHSSKGDRGCSPDGLWFSNTVGAEINITILPNMMLKIGIKPIKKNCLLNKNWFLQGLTLSKRGGPFMLAAVCPQKKKIASFIGQCKVCQTEDLIFGIWTISSCASRCCDIWTAIETKTDVLKRITGKSRGLPKPNYFPLLPPISPADAKRLCRITNKSQGLPGHHYIPALSSGQRVRTSCKVTGKAEGQGPHHYPSSDGPFKPHVFLPGYKYVFPRFDTDEKNHKNLIAVMASKAGVEVSNVRYVYCVEEQKTNLVIPAGLEAAVRDGEVRDVMLDRGGDTILIKMHRGPSVTVDVENFVAEEGVIVWEGMGPSETVLLQRLAEEKEKEKRKAKRVHAIKERKKVFEDREKVHEEEEMRTLMGDERRRMKVLEQKMAGLEKSKKKEFNQLTVLKERLLSESNNGQPLFGHIVQAPTSVEFYPGTSVIDLPEGKIIPGRMEKQDGAIKFVPGMMLEGRFVPGQIVVTNNGEEFVPGQIIETSDGSKFVPGQMVDTESGVKFVPGQTILTEDGYQFVPGQIIETKAGPTFIPGQIIVTDNEAKFVPGRVIDTADGPRFVPGRVVEIGDQVTFVSGQVVDTQDGLRFVAPDLENDLDGVQEFSVQGFEVTPEELRLLRPAPRQAASDAVAAINSEVLKRLSEAGMSIGRQISSELPKVDVRFLPVTSERLRLTGEHAVKVTQVVVALARIAMRVNKLDESCTSIIQFRDAGAEVLSDINHNRNMEKYLRMLVASAVVGCRQKNIVTEEAFMTALSVAIETTLGEVVCQISPENVVDAIHNFLQSPDNLNQIVMETMNYLETSESLSDKIKYAVNGSVEPAQAIGKISRTLDSNMAEAFTEFFLKDPDLFEEVVQQLKDVVNDSTKQVNLVDILQSVIVSVVKQKGKQMVEELIRETDTKNQVGIKKFQTLLRESCGLARALGMRSVATTLEQVASDPKTHEILCGDPTVMAILQRLAVMRQIAEAKPELAESLKKLSSDPEGAKADPGVRELLRRSTALTVVPRGDLRSSAEIPLSLLLSCNNLAVEDHLSATNHPRILLILKAGVQAVVPREAARAVLTGKVPYAVVDEKGIRYFEPLHVFSAMKMPKYAARCFTMYCCPEAEAEERVGGSTEGFADHTSAATKIKWLKSSPETQ